MAAGGGLLIGFALGPARGQRHAGRKTRPRHRQRQAQEHAINAWIGVRTDDSIIVRIAKSEIGQGTLTGLAQLAAEELECDWNDVTTELIEPSRSLEQIRTWGEFATGASRGIRGTETVIRQGARLARLMLMKAAAERWKVPLAELSTSNGRIEHRTSNRHTTYGSCAEAAAALPPPGEQEPIALRPRAQWRIAGKPLPSLDQLDKVTGKGIFGIDVNRPGMLSAAIRAAPVQGGTVASFDAAVAKVMPGVRHVVTVGSDAIAVVAESWWQANKALASITIDWTQPPEAKIDSAGIDAFLKTGLDTEEAFVGRTHGDSLAALRTSTTTLDAHYEVPFLAHAALEPMNATALWSG
ncbi:MAG: molybdopterin cofactor-binding domain-containing protein, partial [Hyphomicrobiaceae bacterium]